MSVVAGDLLEITYNHPELGSGTFYPKSGEDNTFDEGGFRTNDDANSITGSGESIDVINRVRWSVEATVANDNNNREDLTKARQLAAHPLPAQWTFSHVNGTVWAGTGKPVGDIQSNGNAGTFTLKVSGGGELKKIVG